MNAEDRLEIMTTAERPATRPLLIGEILVQADIVQEHQLPRALQMAKDRKLKIGEVLIMMRYLSAVELEPILEIQRLVNQGAIGSDDAIQALKIMRRDGLPLNRALEVIKHQPTDAEAREKMCAHIEAELRQLESNSATAQRDLVPVLLRLGDAQCAARKHVEAEKNYRRALGILEHSHGQKNVKTILAVSKLIDLYMLQQRYLDAEPYCWRLVQIQQDAHGPEHLEVARALERLARCLDAQSRHAEAEQYLLSTIRIMERQLGIEHVELKAALRHLSSFWKRKAKTPEHKRIGELLVDAGLLTNDVLTAALQEAHKNGVPLGQTLLKMQALTETVLAGGLKAQLLVQDGVVPSTVASKALQLVAHKSIDFEEALDEIGWHPDPITTQDLQSLIEMSDELQAAEKSLGANHPGVAVIALKLGEQYTYARKFAYAETAYKRALGILKQCWGQNSLELANCLFKMANLYYVQKRYTEAESLHWRVLEIRKHALGDDHPDVANSLEGIAKLQEAQGNEAMAEQMRQAAAMIRNKDSGRRKEIAEFLKTNTVFGVLDEKMIERVSAIVQEVACHSGQVLVQDHEMPEALYLVLQGTVELVHEGQATYLTCGDCFGDLENPRTTSHKGTVRVPEEARLIRIPSSSMRDFKSKFSVLAAKLEEIAASRVVGTSAATVSAVNQGLQGNLAFFDLTTVLQTIVNSKNSGYLKLSNHKKEEVARLAIKQGNLTHIKFRHLTGLYAMFELLGRSDALDFTFDNGDVSEPDDPQLSGRPLSLLLLEAARRSDELPTLMETLGWPRASYVRDRRVLDCSTFDQEVAMVATDIWMLLDEGLDDNEKVADQVFSDRYTFLVALKSMLEAGFIKKDSKATGSFNRLSDLQT